MSAVLGRQDLVVLTHGKNDEFAIRAILARHRDLGIRPITPVMQRHPEHDSGCFDKCHVFLRPKCRRFQHALVVVDRAASYAKGRSPAKLEKGATNRLLNAGWGDRAGVVVIDPELEVWVWNNSTQVDEALRWSDRDPPLRKWLLAEKWIEPGTVKPKRPKEAYQAALRFAQKNPSAEILRKLASEVNWKGCVDPAFLRLQNLLQRWFPA